MESVNTDRSPVRLAFLFAAVALLCANLPHLLGVLWTPDGVTFTGLTHNQDDAAVYLSWIRQASEGRFFFTNRFTTEPQRGLPVNLFFYLLGTVGRIMHLSPPAVYAGARMVFGGLLLAALWRLVSTVLADKRAQLLAFAFLCFAAGFGFALDLRPANYYEQPIDRWQPEAITFLTIYVTPLFSAALALMAVFAASFFRAEQTGKSRDLLPACVAGFLLGNFHSYDILQLWAFAFVYRVLTDVLRKRVETARYGRLLIVGLAMLPTAGYQLYAITNEAVFNARVFATSTLSPSPIWILLGFGLPFLLAAAAPFAPGAKDKLAPDALRYLFVWAVVAIAISYAVGLNGKPVSFQRKLLMGAHIPVCLLAGATLAAVTEKLSGSLPVIVSLAAVLITVPSNLRFMLQDVNRLQTNTSGSQYRPYLSADETSALRFLRETAKPGEAVLVCPDMTAHRYGGSALMPYLGVYIPAYSSASVYAAHWSETADFQRKYNEQLRFFAADTPDDSRQSFLAANPAIRYILYADAVGAGLTNANGELIVSEQTGAPFWRGVDWAGQPPSYLEAVYESGTVRVLRVR
ncbi:MAG: hypothetical protein H7Y38_16185 [Armatimonadetes bacterium]|nr:hypothetical protein [Armatimonadota bacterium]